MRFWPLACTANYITGGFLRGVLPGCLMLLISVGTSWAQDSLNTTVLGRSDLYDTYSDVWGYTTNDNRELAILGVSNGTSIVDVTDPANATELAFFSGPSSLWRDMKEHAGYAYVVTEGPGGGMQIIDLESVPPDSITTYSATFDRAHNLAIADGIAYVFGARMGNSQVGTRILSLANPTSPVEVGNFGTFYVHDGIVRNNVMYAAAINDDQLGIIDVANPAAPVILKTFTWAGSNAHNCDLTDDGNFVLTTDEVTGGDLHIFDISDLQNVQQVATWTANTQAIIHNVYVNGTEAYVSYYTEGLRILDISNPAFPVEIAYYDTWPGASGGFDGNWGAYPYLASGNVLVSDSSSGLLVVGVDIQSGAVEGTITEEGVGSPIQGAQVQITGGNGAQSSASGFYKIYDDPGPVDIDVSAFGFEPLQSSATLVAGASVNLDLALIRLPHKDVTGTITEAGGGSPVHQASVLLHNSPWASSSDASGDYDFPQVPYGAYQLAVSRFGFIPQKLTISVTDHANPPTYDFVLQASSSAEDFEGGPSGWSVGGAGDTATSGIWVWAEPNGTGGGLVQPEDDHTLDPGVVCWVTGNAAPGASIGADDVDGGKTTLTSTLFDASGMTEPQISFWRWFSNDAGSIPGPPDTLRVDLSNNGGGGWTSVEKITQSAPWTLTTIRIKEHLLPTNLMLLRIVAEDTGTGSVVEAAIDDVMLFDSPATDAGVGPQHTRLRGNYPNPFNPNTTIRYSLSRADRTQIQIFDARGRLVRSFPTRHRTAGHHVQVWDGRNDAGRPVASGVYLCQLVAGKYVDSRRMILAK